MRAAEGGTKPVIADIPNLTSARRSGRTPLSADL
jgi:hypothetical protein